jgi:hypothetical protein
MKPDIDNVSGWMEEKISGERDIGIGGSKSKLTACIEGEQIADAAADNESTDFNAARYFFSSQRLLSSEKFDYPESKAILSFRTVWPRRSFSSENWMEFQYPAQWMNRFSGLGVCSNDHYLGPALHNALSLLFACPVWLQDVLVDVLSWGLVLSVCFLHLQLYSWGAGYFVVIPGCLVLVALCYAILNFHRLRGGGPTKATRVAAISDVSRKIDKKLSPSSRHMKPHSGRRTSADGGNRSSSPGSAADSGTRGQEAARKGDREAAMAALPEDDASESLHSNAGAIGGVAFLDGSQEPEPNFIRSVEDSLAEDEAEYAYDEPERDVPDFAFIRSVEESFADGDDSVWTLPEDQPMSNATGYPGARWVPASHMRL